MWTWAPEGNAGAATRTATKLWNDPEYNNLRSGLVSARESLCRGLGARWFTERFHRNALVTHVQHGQVFCTARRLQNYAVARCRLHQRAPQGRHPTDGVAVEIDLVGAHDAHYSLRSRGIGIADGRSKECPRRRLPRSRTFRVNHFRGIDSLGEKANPPIDLAQPPLAVLIVGVFTAIAVTGSPRHYLRHGRAVPAKQKPVLIVEALQPARRYVVLALRRGLVRLWFSREPFSHLSESGRQSCLKIDLFSGDGVVEFQILGVQEISSIAGEAGEIFKRLTGKAVQRIAY